MVWLTPLTLFFIYLGWFGSQAPDVQAQFPLNEPGRIYAIILYDLNFAPPIFIAIALIFPPGWCFFCYALYFRRSPLKGKTMSYTLSNVGIKFETDGLRQANAWSLIGGAREGKNGFLLYFGKGRNSFHWLPKIGFETKTEIEQCRELLRQHVPNFS